MKHDLATIAANMMHDARNGVSAELGSGIFTPDELREAAAALRVFPDLLASLEGLCGLAEMRSGNLHEYKAAVTAARAAITKAKGI